MAELANGNVLKVPSPQTHHMGSQPSDMVRNKILGNNKKHMFKRRDTPMTLNHAIDPSKSPHRFVPKFESSFEEPEQDDQPQKPDNIENGTTKSS